MLDGNPILTSFQGISKKTRSILIHNSSENLPRSSHNLGKLSENIHSQYFKTSQPLLCPVSRIFNERSEIFAASDNVTATTSDVDFNWSQ